jgi:hypothetical protein
LQIVQETLSPKQAEQNGLQVWLKGESYVLCRLEAGSSNPIPIKKKKKKFKQPLSESL